MDAVTAVLGAFSPTQAAAESVKKYDSVLKDHVAAVKSLLTNQRQVITENTSQILQACITFLNLSHYINFFRPSILQSILSHF